MGTVVGGGKLSNAPSSPCGSPISYKFTLLQSQKGVKYSVPSSPSSSSFSLKPSSLHHKNKLPPVTAPSSPHTPTIHTRSGGGRTALPRLLLQGLQKYHRQNSHSFGDSCLLLALPVSVWAQAVSQVVERESLRLQELSYSWAEIGPTTAWVDID